MRKQVETALKPTAAFSWCGDRNVPPDAEFAKPGLEAGVPLRPLLWWCLSTQRSSLDGR